MTEMRYTIFFDNRCIDLSDSEEYCFDGMNSVGIRYCDSKQLSDLIDEFENSSIKELRIYSENPSDTFKEFSSFNKVIRAAGGIVRNSQNQLLIINRLKHWDLPKGKIEKNETNDVAALREVEEECGIDKLELVGFATYSYHVYRTKSARVLKITDWFYMNYLGNKTPTPQHEEDIESAIWVDEKELPLYYDTMYVSIRKVLSDATGVL